MRLADERHYTEEELLMHLLGEEAPEMANDTAAHLEKCGQCRMVFQEFQQVRKNILLWEVPEIPEEVWERRKAQLMKYCRDERLRTNEAGALAALVRWVRGAWSYALENPLPTLGYVIVAVAFASERTITVFRLDRILPATNEVLAILRQVF